MKDIFKKLKKFMMHPTVHTLVLALTAMYLMFGVLNAGFILVQVLASLVDFFLNHLPTDWNIVNVWDRGIVFG
jgi:membrane-bound ClpP family serine protease